MRKTLFFAVLLLGLGFGHVSEAAWFDTNWSNKFSIISSTTLVDITSSSIVLLVDLANAPTGFWSVVQPDGDDIRVTSSTETGTLNYELLGFSTSSRTGELWVNVGGDGISSTTAKTFYIYYGNAAASAGSSATSTNADYSGVWHLTGLADSGPNGNNFTAGGSHGTSTGKIGAAADFVAAQIDFLRVGTSTLSSYTNSHISAWYKPTNAASEKGLGFSITSEFTGGVDFVAQGNTNSSNDGANWLVGFHYLAWRDTGSDWTANGTWDRLDVVNAAGTWRYYFNGEETANSNIHTDAPSLGTSTLVGASNQELASPGQVCDCSVDEVRVERFTRPIGWIRTQYNSENSTSTFWAFGAQEAQEVEVAPARRRVYIISWMNKLDYSRFYAVIRRIFSPVVKALAKGDSAW